jgi:2-keto-4-pentenoate hydratase/2-oxohepta-3-ene-1,7-dioic acid hydratase in catechol pathway
VKLTSFRSSGSSSSYGLVVDDGIVDLHRRLGNRTPDLRALLADPDGLKVAWDLSGEDPDHGLAEVRFLPVIPEPAKIICVGLNYEDHRLEAGLPVTSTPALFLRTPDSQTGHLTPILRPRESATLDYEAELAVIIGRAGRRIDRDHALEHVAGYACYNDGSVREYQRHTQQYTAGKIFPGTGAFGPWMVTSDEIPNPSTLTVTCRLNGEVVQNAGTEQMLFSVPQLIEYISTVTPLAPGDVIVTGTPAGVGSRRDPQLWLQPGDEVEVEVDRIGVLVNSIADE